MFPLRCCVAFALAACAVLVMPGELGLHLRDTVRRSVHQPSAWLGVAQRGIQRGIAYAGCPRFGSLGPDTSSAGLQRCIRRLKLLSGGGGMEVEEYTKMFEHVRHHAPQRLLVWGLGWDSEIYNALNRGGETLFLEPDAHWVKTVVGLRYHTYNRTLLGTTAAAARRYTTGTGKAKMKSISDRALRATNLWRVVGESCYDSVLVDSPAGWQDRQPGRAVPIYTAASMARRCSSESKVTVFVHDTVREGESRLSAAFLGKTPNSTTGPKKLLEFAFGPCHPLLNHCTDQRAHWATGTYNPKFDRYRKKGQEGQPWRPVNHSAIAAGQYMPP